MVNRMILLTNKSTHQFEKNVTLKTKILIAWTVMLYYYNSACDKKKIIIGLNINIVEC